MVAGLVLWGLLAGAPSGEGASDGPADADLRLYSAISDRMASGTGYYAAVAAEQARLGYPTRPVVTVREPTLAWLIDGVGGPAVTRWLLVALATVAAAVTMIRLRAMTSSLTVWGCASVLAALSFALMASADLIWVHEIWAGMLIALSVGLRTRSSWGTSVAIGLAAALVRELAAPYLVVMLVLAWRDRRRREAAGWAIALTVWAAFYALHALRVADLVPASAQSSPGWIDMDGWPLFVEMIHSRSLLVLLPFWVSAVLVPLALLGWWSCRSGYALRVAWLLSAYALAFSVVGRADTTYWGFLVAALVLPGLAMVPKVPGRLAQNRDPGRRSVGELTEFRASSRSGPRQDSPN
ncbi:hypothetical protein [Aeromicrobium sp. UC242_57]|uniref:hypothetical protein n=1 Tax=Aeromicrobium sp. UC242_57 TaxID=3374624 RepID=UPI0037C020A7